MATQQPAQALASHLVSQTLSSVALLETLGLVNAADAAEIRKRLPNPYATFPSLAMNATGSTPNAPSGVGAASVSGIAGGMASMALQSQPPQSLSNTQSVTNSAFHQNNQSQHTPGHVPGPALPARHAPEPQRARALWDYNGTDADDLRFRQGDTVIIDEEVNKEWFRGRLVGKEGEKGGLFPSNYVEKLPMTQPTINEKAGAYQPPGAAASYYTPPPSQVAQYASPPSGYMPPEQQSAGGTTIVVQEDPKKGKFGKMGGQLGNAAVTGAGFGFGSAVASNIVNAIL